VRTILGREPAVIIGLVGAIVTVIVALGVDWLDAGAGVAVTALITAGITAATTRPVTPSIAMGVLTALAALLAEYQINLSEELIASLGGLVIAVFAVASTRPQVTPVYDPR
jgi:hypothetical protein